MWKKAKVGIKSISYAEHPSRARVIVSYATYLSVLYLEFLVLAIKGICYKFLQGVVGYCIRIVRNIRKWERLSARQTSENISEGEQR